MIRAINRLFRYVRELIGFNPKVAPEKTINKLFTYARKLHEYPEGGQDNPELMQDFKIKSEQIIDELLSRKEEHSKAIKKEILWRKLGRKDINPYDKKLGITLLHFIVEGFLDIELLRHFSLRDLKKTGELFALAIRKNNIDAIKWLLDNHVSPNAKDNEGDPVLHMAIWCDESFEIAKLLIAKGANINARSLDGKTALHAALPRCKTSVIDFIIRAGADVNAKDKQENSAIDKVFVNCCRGDKKIIISDEIRLKSLSLLIDHGAKVTSGSIKLIMYRDFQNAATKSTVLLLMLGSALGIEIDMTNYFVYQFFRDENNVKAIFKLDGYQTQKNIAKENIFKSLQEYGQAHYDQNVLNAAQCILDDDAVVEIARNSYLSHESHLLGNFDSDIEDIT